jgi:hypothetical protein
LAANSSIVQIKQKIAVKLLNLIVNRSDLVLAVRALLLDRFDLNDYVLTDDLTCPAASTSTLSDNRGQHKRSRTVKVPICTIIDHFFFFALQESACLFAIGVIAPNYFFTSYRISVFSMIERIALSIKVQTQSI